MPYNKTTVDITKQVKGENINNTSKVPELQNKLAIIYVHATFTELISPLLCMFLGKVKLFISILLRYKEINTQSY
jgi:hypothetical protein